MLTAVSAMKALTSQEEGVAFRSPRHIPIVSSSETSAMKVPCNFSLCSQCLGLGFTSWHQQSTEKSWSTDAPRKRYGPWSVVPPGRHKRVGLLDSTPESFSLAHAVYGIFLVRDWGFGAIGFHSCQRPSRPVITTLCAFLPGVFSAAEMEEGDGDVDNEGLECRKALPEGPFMFVSCSTVFRAYCSEELLVKSSLHIAVSSRAPDVLCRRCVCELGATNKRIE